MDPNANLREQETLLTRIRQCGWANQDTTEDRRVLRELRVAMAMWLARGGFAPDWTVAPQARVYFNR